MENLPGTYLLILKSVRNNVLQIGKLGQLDLVPGYYLYVGSAFGPGGVESRVSHHRKASANLHWHIDYLRSELPLKEIWYSCDPVRREHQWAGEIKKMEGAVLPLKKFGASDCHCETHLFFFRKRPSKFIFSSTIHSQYREHRSIHRERVK
ncbi:MAG: GIY-YIG nuclease family protein [SAR324 cluster bacterium]|nr:GIY-YIG nuclease family protein [SAR324 cluster bacterium]